MEEQMWSRFGRKTILYFTGYKDSRVPSMEEELARVGMDNVDRQWQFPTPFDDVFFRCMKHIPDLTKSMLNLSLAHYRAVATAYHLGFDTALIMEDDIRFLKDKERLGEIIDSLPEDYDIAMMDAIPRFDKNDFDRYLYWKNECRLNENWAHFDRMYSTACYAVSRKGMERLMFCVEAIEKRPMIFMMRNPDHFMDRHIIGKDAKMYFSINNACIQSENKDCLTNTGFAKESYEKMGVDPGMYA